MTSSNAAKLILITGIMAAGKSSVSERLARRLPKSVHLRGDSFRRMIVNGRVDMTPDASLEARTQLALRYRIAAAVAKAYVEAGFDVVYQDVLLGAYLEEVVELLRPLDVHVVVLCPSAEVVAQRESGRQKRGYREFTPADLDRVLREETDRIGLWLDSSSQTLDETVEAILARLDEARLPNHKSPASA